MYQKVLESAMHDSHTHLTLEPLSESYIEAVKRFKDNGGKYLLNVSYDYESIERVIKQHRELATRFPGLAHMAIGLHPEIIETDARDPFKFANKGVEYVREHVRTYKGKISAIGEIGLDYFHISREIGLDPEKKAEVIEAQKALFTGQLEIALTENLPVTIHTRDANGENDCIKDALSIVASVGKGKLRGAFHSYTGDIKMLDDILALGFYIGFNGILTYPSGENVRDIASVVPNDRLLLETDAPLLPPQNVRKDKARAIKHGQPEDVAEILAYMAEIKGMSVQRLEEITDRNFENLFLSN